MTDRELMQQALDALEEINKLSIGESAICLPAEIDGALDALRERLAQPEQCRYPDCKCATENPCLKGLAQPEQEPVAWMDPSWANPDTQGWASESFKSAPIDGWTPLYTTPPQRKPLPPQSPCEMTQAERKMFKLGWLECEAAHGIKENT